MNTTDPLFIDWSRAVPIESRDGKRKAVGIVVDWLRPMPSGLFPSIVGVLPPHPGGGEGGAASVTQGDWFIREGDSVHVQHRDAFAREWRDVAGEARAEAVRAQMAAAQAVLDAQNEAARKAKEIADAKRLLDEKCDAEKRERDGSNG